MKLVWLSYRYVLETQWMISEWIITMTPWYHIIMEHHDKPWYHIIMEPICAPLTIKYRFQRFQREDNGVFNQKALPLTDTEDLCAWNSELNRVVVSNILSFHPYLGKIPILPNMFQRGWNHQLVKGLTPQISQCVSTTNWWTFQPETFWKRETKKYDENTVDSFRHPANSPVDIW